MQLALHTCVAGCIKLDHHLLNDVPAYYIQIDNMQMYIPDSKGRK